MSDKLQNMVNMQRSLMKALGVYDPQSLNRKLEPSMSMHYMEAASGVVCEAAEVLELVTKMTRPWKAKMLSKAEERYSALLEELTDVLFYTLELLIHLGLDEHDVEHQFKRKQAIVNARILEADSTQDEIIKALVEIQRNEKQLLITTLFENIIKATDYSPAINVVELSKSPVKYITEHFNETK